MFNKKNKSKNHRTSLKTTRLVSVSFLSVILIGAILLSLPISSATGKATNFLDALFTSTSATCVTGLVTKVTYSYWSLFGKIVILILIQIGGIGVVSLIAIIAELMGKKISIKHRVLIQKSYNFDSIGGMVRFINTVALGTLIVEAIGAFFYCLVFIPEYGFFKGIWISIFTSISAFCNAGIDIISNDSLNKYVGNFIININTMLLIVIGGLGFPVWNDMIRVGKMVAKKKISYKNFFHKLHLHAKIVLTLTGLLIFIGTILILLFEWNNAFYYLSIKNKVLASLFQSVTFRTAGFQTVNQSDLTNSTVILGSILMFIGGSPVGCAGGMKTTTFAMLILVALSAIHEKKNPEIFNRKISTNNIKIGITVFAVYFSLWLMFVMIFFSAEPLIAFEDGIFETISAIGTVGLSRGITASLSGYGKLVLIVLMFLGRTGPITVAMAIRGGSTSDNAVELSEEEVMIG